MRFISDAWLRLLSRFTAIPRTSNSEREDDAQLRSEKWDTVHEARRTLARLETQLSVRQRRRRRCS